MIFLLIVSLIWAFSFGLIKNNLVGIDPNFVAFIRLFISFLIFLPFLKLKQINSKIFFSFAFTGAVQYGIMYISYIYAFHFIKAYEVALFTIFTPIYIVIINDLLKHKFHPGYYGIASIALIGTAIIVWHNITSAELLTGFILVQTANISFAYGQLNYKNVMRKFPELNDTDVFALLYLGGVFIAFPISLFTTDCFSLILSGKEIYTLLYLGIVASGVGFFLWNYGARRVNTGSLAVYNNLKIPLAIIVSIIFFSEKINISNLLIGGLIVTFALVINEYRINKQYTKLND
jgi:drug/metabolite transporter (DMT)-like permease